MKVKGLRELQKQLKQLGDGMGPAALSQAARKAFKPVLDAAKAMAPRDTGALAESLVQGTARANGGKTVAVGIVVGGGAKGKRAAIAGAVFGTEGLPPARRWHFSEFGTSKQPAHPFLRPAIDRNADNVVDGLKTELGRTIARIVQKGGK